jgi:single-strand DNA-binding protein
MAGYNKIILVGNMTRDVEIRTLQSGSIVGGFGIAVNRRIRLSTGEEREEVCFVDCTAFDKRAETLRQYTHKGSLILVEGRLRMDNWTDKVTGQPRSKLAVVVENIQLLDRRDPNAQPQGGYQQGGWGQPQGGYQQPQGGWGQAQPAQGGWGQQPPPAQAAWGQQPQGGYQQGGSWGQQPQGGYQQGGWGQSQPAGGWNQPAAGNPPPAFTPPPAFSGATVPPPPPPAFVPPADVKAGEPPSTEAAAAAEQPQPAANAQTAESPNDDLPF